MNPILAQRVSPKMSFAMTKTTTKKTSSAAKGGTKG
jgi:hypothetical protein